VQGRRAVEVLAVGVGSTVEEKLDELGVAVNGGHLQGRHQHFRRGIDLSPVFEKHPADLDVAGEGC